MATLKLSRPMSPIRASVNMAQDSYTAFMHKLARRDRTDRVREYHRDAGWRRDGDEWFWGNRQNW